jgi:hypothetical protein
MSKLFKLARHGGSLMPVIPVTQEVEIRRWWFGASSGKKKTPSSTKKPEGVSCICNCSNRGGVGRRIMV